MKKATGFYPRLRVDTSASGAVGQAGGVLLTETVTSTGLGRELSVALGPWRKRLAIHDPAKVITDLAITLALGGDCLADIALLRLAGAVLVEAHDEWAATDRRYLSEHSMAQLAAMTALAGQEVDAPELLTA